MLLLCCGINVIKFRYKTNGVLSVLAATAKQPFLLNFVYSMLKHQSADRRLPIGYTGALCSDRFELSKLAEDMLRNINY